MKKQNTKIVFFGSDSFSVPILEALINSGYQVLSVVTKDDKTAGRGQQKMANPLKQYAQAQKLPLKIVEKLDENNTKKIQELNADLYISPLSR